MTLKLSRTEPHKLIPIIMQKATDRCHVMLPGAELPTSAISFDNHLYVFVKFFESDAIARQKAELFSSRGNSVVLTRVPKGLVLWVLEPEAQIFTRITSSRVE